MQPRTIAIAHLGSLLDNTIQQLKRRKFLTPGVEVFYRWSFVLGGNIVRPERKFSFIHQLTCIIDVSGCIVNSMIPYDFFRHTHCYSTFLVPSFIFISPIPLMRISIFQFSLQITIPFYFLLCFFHTPSRENIHFYFHCFCSYSALMYS